MASTDIKLDAIILAGGNAGGLSEGVSCKGLVRICDRPMVEYVIDSLRGSSRIRRIVVVLPDAGTGRWQKKVDEVVISYGNVVDNFLAAVEVLGDSDRVLVVSGDVPLITAEAIDDYLAKCEPFEGDLYYPIATKQSVEAKFPGVQRTYMRLRGGTFTGGNIGLVNPAAIVANRTLMESVFDLRKSPLGLVRILGFGFIVKFFLRRLTVDELEQKVSELIKGKGRAIVVTHPEIGFDVDKPADLALATRVLAGDAC
jgi:GTP:adenosylcobinamide-phosphate guanylyltransferase